MYSTSDRKATDVVNIDQALKLTVDLKRRGQGRAHAVMTVVDK